MKEKRIVDAACEKDDQSRDIQSATSTCDVKGSIDGDANGKSSNHSHTTEELFTEGDEAPDKTTSATARVGFGLGDEDHEPQLVIEIANQQTERSEGDGMEGEKEGRTHEVEATLFSLEEADALTVYLVGGDHARPLINVADIQHGTKLHCSLLWYKPLVRVCEKALKERGMSVSILCLPVVCEFLVKMCEKTLRERGMSNSLFFRLISKGSCCYVLLGVEGRRRK